VKTALPSLGTTTVDHRISITPVLLIVNEGCNRKLLLNVRFPDPLPTGWANACAFITSGI